MESCSICLCAPENGDEDVLPCGHTFCSHCIVQWLEDNTKCPNCRADPVIFKLQSVEFTYVCPKTFDYYTRRCIELEFDPLRTTQRLEQRLISMSIAIDNLTQEFTHNFQSQDGRFLEDIIPGVENISLLTSSISQMINAKIDAGIDNIPASIPWYEIPYPSSPQFLHSIGPVEDVKARVEKCKDDFEYNYIVLHLPSDYHCSPISCRGETCPCNSEVSKVFVFDSENITVRGTTLFPNSQAKDNLNPKGLIWVQGSMKRRHVRNIARPFPPPPPPPPSPLHPLPLPLPPLPAPPPPLPPGREFMVGQRVTKTAGVGSGQTGIINDIVGRKMRVGRWRLQNSYNYRA